jgi:hypothetical protein
MPSGQAPSNCLRHAPAGQGGISSLLTLWEVSLPSLWQASQKWVVPKQNHTATEQQ